MAIGQVRSSKQSKSLLREVRAQNDWGWTNAQKLMGNMFRRRIVHGEEITSHGCTRNLLSLLTQTNKVLLEYAVCSMQLVAAL